MFALLDDGLKHHYQGADIWEWLRERFMFMDIRTLINAQTNCTPRPEALYSDLMYSA